MEYKRFDKKVPSTKVQQKNVKNCFLPLSIFFHFLVHDTKMWVSPSSIIYLGKFASNLFGLSSLFAFLFEPHVLPFHLCSFAPFLCHGRGSNSSLTPFRVRLQFAFAHSFQSPPLSLSLSLSLSTSLSIAQIISLTYNLVHQRTLTVGGKYHCTASLEFNKFGFNRFTMYN